MLRAHQAVIYLDGFGTDSDNVNCFSLINRLISLIYHLIDAHTADHFINSTFCKGLAISWNIYHYFFS